MALEYLEFMNQHLLAAEDALEGFNTAAVDVQAQSRKVNQNLATGSAFGEAILSTLTKQNAANKQLESTKTKVVQATLEDEADAAAARARQIKEITDMQISQRGRAQQYMTRGAESQNLADLKNADGSEMGPVMKVITWFNKEGNQAKADQWYSRADKATGIATAGISAKSTILSNEVAIAARHTAQERKVILEQAQATEVANAAMGDTRLAKSELEIYKFNLGLDQAALAGYQADMKVNQDVMRGNIGLMDIKLRERQLETANRRSKNSVDKFDMYVNQINRFNKARATSYKSEILAPLLAKGDWAGVQSMVGVEDYPAFMQSIGSDLAITGAETDPSKRIDTELTDSVFSKQVDSLLQNPAMLEKYQAEVVKQSGLDELGFQGIKAPALATAQAKAAKELLSDFNRDKTELAGNLALDSEQIMIGDMQLREALAGSSLSEDTMKVLLDEVLDQGIITGSVDSPKALGNSISRTMENMHKTNLDTQAIEASIEMIATVFQDQVVNATERNFGELYRGTDMTALELTANVNLGTFEKPRMTKLDLTQPLNLMQLFNTARATMLQREQRRLGSLSMGILN